MLKSSNRTMGLESSSSSGHFVRKAFAQEPIAVKAAESVGVITGSTRILLRSSSTRETSRLFLREFFVSVRASKGM